MRILIVEDEPDLRKVLLKRLSAEHYSVDAVDNGADALHYISMAEYDCVLLDIMIPQINGLEVLRRIRADENSMPVLLLTAKDAIEDRVVGLDSGADDYLVKPFAFDELLARIRVLTRRPLGAVSNIFQVDDLKVDCHSRTVTRGNDEIELSSKEFAILEYLIRDKVSSFRVRKLNSMSGIMIMRAGQILSMSIFVICVRRLIAGMSIS